MIMVYVLNLIIRLMFRTNSSLKCEPSYNGKEISICVLIIQIAVLGGITEDLSWADTGEEVVQLSKI